VIDLRNFRISIAFLGGVGLDLRELTEPPFTIDDDVLMPDNETEGRAPTAPAPVP
jgi:hypothetical protein